MSPWHRILTDAALVERARRDDAEAFEELVRRHQRSAHAVAAALGVAPSNRDDVVQESFLRAFRGLAGMKEAQKFGAWLRQIARRESLRSLERSPRDAAAEDLDIGSGERRDDVENAELRERVSRVVETLPLELREAIFAYYYEGLSTRLAARALGVSVSNLKHRLQRGRALLRVRLGRELGAELGVPAIGRATWACRARSLSLIVAAALPSSWASRAAAAAGGSGARLTPLLQAGLMTTRNIALGVTLALTIAVSIAAWWLASGRPREDLAALRPGGEAPAALPGESGAAPGRVLAPAELPRAATEAEKAAVEQQAQAPPALRGRVLDVRGQPVAGARVVPLSSGVLDLAVRFSHGAQDGVDPFTRLRALREDIHRRLDNVREAVTDETGRYTVPSLAAGEYRVLVTHPSHLPMTEAWIEVSAEGTATRDVTLEDGGRIRGRVLAHDGTPIAGARVSVESAERRGVRGIGSAMVLAMTLANGTDFLDLGSTRTGAAGDFEIGSLEPALRDVRAVHDGYLARTIENVEVGSTVELRLSRARPLRGRITDAAGAPIPSAMVTLRVPRPSGDPGSPLALLAADVDLRDERTRSTDCEKDGSFVLYPSQSGLYEVVLRAPRRLESRRMEQLGEREVNLGNVVLDAGRNVRGAVLSVTGEPARARVSARLLRPVSPRKPNALELASTRTEEGGRFTLWALPEDDLIITAVDEALGTATVELNAGDPSTLELRMPAGEVIEGIVVDASSEEPVAGASVSLHDGQARDTTTAEDGTFRFAGIPADIGEQDGGHIYLSVKQPSYKHARLDQAWAPGKIITVALEPQPLARGVVVDASGSPVPGARLAIEVPGLPRDLLLLVSESSSVLGGAFSGADGRFELRVALTAPPRNEIHVVAAHPSLGRGRAPLALESPVDLRIELRPGTKADVTVRDASGSPVKGARVSLERFAELPPEVALFKGLLSGLAEAAALTGEDGRAVLRDLEPGTYDVVASAPGFAIRRLERVAIDPAVAAIDVVLEPGRDLSGRVVDQLLTAVPEAEVVAFDLAALAAAPAGGGPEDEEAQIAAGLLEAAGRGAATATSDAHGRFTLRDLPPGKYQLVVRGPGFRPVEVGAAEPGRQLPDIQVERWAALALQVRDARSGLPVTSFQVTLTPQGSGSPVERVAEEVTNGAGKFERGRLLEGPVGIEVRAAGRAPWLGLVNVAGGTRRDVEVLLFPQRRVSGLIRSATTKEPIAGVSVVLGSGPLAADDPAASEPEVLDGRWFQSSPAVTDAAGRFAIGDAREGELRIRIQHPEFYDPAAATRGPIAIRGEDLELDPIELAPGGVVDVTLEGWSAPAEPGIHFCVDAIGRAPRERPELRPIETAVIDPQGRCRITGLPPGPYDLQLRPLGAAPAGFTHGPQPLGAVTVGERETVELNVRTPAQER